MKAYPTEKIRNIALIGHATSGKTTLSDAILYAMKAIPRIGDVHNGSATLDYSAAEHKRQISLQLASGFGDWRGNHLNILDTPGYDDFVGETCAALRVADCALLVLNAVSGVESGSERTFEMARELNLPTLVCVNMMDKENADFDKAIAQAQSKLSSKIVPLQLPIGQGSEFTGLVGDLFKMKAFIYGKDGQEAKEQDIPAEYQAKAEAAREVLIEAVAEFDDSVIEKYLEGEKLTREEILSALKLGVSKGGAYPAVVTSAPLKRGVRRMLDAFVVCFPSPGERPPVVATMGDESVELPPDPNGIPAALVFKTVIEQHLGELSLIRVFSGTFTSGSEAYNSSRGSMEKLGQLYILQGKDRTEVANLNAGEIGAAVKFKDTHTGNTLATKAKPVVLPPIEFPTALATEAVFTTKKGDEDKMGVALHKLMEEDPTVQLEVDPELHQHLLHAMGELHMEVVLDKLRDRHVSVELKKPRIHYLETIRKSAEGQGKYKKQSGGRGQYGDVWLKLEHTPGTGYEFVNKIVGGVVPGKFIPAVDKGVQEAMRSGVMAGYPVVDVRVTLYDGSHHQVDSSEMAFKVAGSMAFKKLMQEAAPILLEPIMEVEVTVPDDHTGDVMGDTQLAPGKILGMTPSGMGQVVKALVPGAEMYKYLAQLRSMTQGRGRFTMSYSSHEEIPRDSAERIVAAAKEAREESEGN